MLSGKAKAGPSVPSLQYQARLLAQTLIQEITLNPPASTKKDFELLPEVPLRKDLDFRQTGGVDVPKATLGQNISANEGSEFFCSGHGEFALGSGTDIDHVFSYSKIRERQVELLKFLNSDLDFANIFIKEPGIDNFFDITAGTVQATRYFFKQCYNAIDNLMLLCHACNVKKSGADPLPSFEEKIFFGPEFIEDMQDRPDVGPKEGIIFPRVYATASKECSIKLGGIVFSFYAGDDGVGLGEFARNWFFETSESVLKIHREFKEVNFAALKKDLGTVRSMMLSGPTEESKKILERLCSSIPILFSVYQVFTKISASTSTSDSEDSSGKRGQQEDAERAMIAVVRLAHVIKKIKKRCKDYFGEDASKGISTLCRDLNRGEAIQIDEWRSICSYLEHFLKSGMDDGKKSIEAAKKMLAEQHIIYAKSVRLASSEAKVQEQEQTIAGLAARMDQLALELEREKVRTESDITSEPKRKVANSGNFGM